MFPSGLMGPAGLTLLLLGSIPAFAQARPGSALTYLANFAIAFAMLWTFFAYTRGGGDLPLLLRRATLIVLPFAALSVIDGLFGWPGWHSPVAFGAQPLWWSGFNGGRTGWSMGLAFFVPAAYVGIRHTHYPPWVRRLLTGAALTVLIGAQITCGGRGGLLASLCILALIGYVSVPSVRLLMLTVATTLAFAVLADTGAFLAHLRLDELAHPSTGGTVAMLDRFSSGRMEGYLTAFRMIGERPLWGYGFGEANLIRYNPAFRYAQVHNFWLFMQLQGGVMLTAGLGVFCAAMLRTGLRRLREGGVRLLPGALAQASALPAVLPFGLCLMLIGGHVIALFEPDPIFGAFQNVALFWAAAGSLSGMAHEDPSGPSPEPTPAPAPLGARVQEALAGGARRHL